MNASSQAVATLSRKSPLDWGDFHLLISSMREYAIFLLDADGHVAVWSPGAQHIKGYSDAEVAGRHISMFYTPEDQLAGKPQRLLEAAVEQGRASDEGWCVRRDGSLFWSAFVITALRDDAGTLRGFGKVVRDLTETKQVIEALRRSEERFRLLVEQVQDYAIFMLDPTGHVSSWNEGARQIKGYSSHEIIGTHFSVFYPEADDRARRCELELVEAAAKGRFEDEGWRIRKDGSRFWANVVITALHNSAGDLIGFAKVTRDLTARREAEQTARELARAEAAREYAEDANRIKDDFLAIVSHELRTPLSAIVGWASVLRHRAKDPAVAKAVAVIDRNAQAQVKIIDDILDVSRIIAGKLRLDTGAADLTAIARDAIEVVRPAAAAKQISIDLDQPGEVLFVGDRDRIQQVVWNLLSNAVKFSDPGSKVYVTIEPRSSTVALSVSDTGRGIAPDFLPLVFDRFKQADGSTTRRAGGLGLGLALVRHLVELHGGHVAAESPGTGEGATFTVTLPLRAVVPAVVRGDLVGPPPDSDSSVLRGLRLLVVDDDADARDLLEAVLTGAGAQVATAGSAQDGLAALRRFRPHILISDIGMPVADGYTFVHQVRALSRDEGGGIPSVALTAYTRNEDRTKALAAGFTTHIGKPVNPPDLVSAVANLAPFTRA